MQKRIFPKIKQKFFNYKHVLYTSAAGAFVNNSSESKKNSKIIEDINSKTKLDQRDYYKGTYLNRIRDLSTPEKIFTTFASVHKKGDEIQVKYMTLDDFASSILPFDFRSTSDKGSISSDIEKNFYEFTGLSKEQNDDNVYISQAEYVLFSTLLSIPEDHIEIAFKMFDLDANGVVDKEEFLNLMNVIRGRSFSAYSFQAATKGSKFLKKLFGEDGKETLSINVFRKYIQTLRRFILDIEFERYDRNKTGFISAHDFALSIIGYCSRSKIKLYLNRLDSLNVEGTISKEEFLAFNLALPKLNDVGLALHLYSESNECIRKSDFQRAVFAVSGVLLTKVQVDTIYYIFDENDNGQLEQSELLGALKHRYENKQYEHRDLGFLALLGCIKNCLN